MKEAGFTCVTNELYVGLLSLNMAWKSCEPHKNNMNSNLSAKVKNSHASIDKLIY